MGWMVLESQGHVFFGSVIFGMSYRQGLHSTVGKQLLVQRRI